MDHHPVAHIDGNVACTGCVVGSLEEDDISRFCLTPWNDGKLLSQAFRRGSTIIPAIAAVVDHPAHKAGAVKTGQSKLVDGEEPPHTYG